MIEKNIIGQENVEDRFPTYKTNPKEDPNLIEKTTPVDKLYESEHIRSDKSSVDSLGQWRNQSEKQRKERLYKERKKASDNELIKKRTFHQELEKAQNQLETPVQKKPYSSLHLNPGREWLGELLNYIEETNRPINPDNIVIPSKKSYHNRKDKRLRIAQVMSQEVYSIIDTTSVEQASNLMNSRKISGLPVVHYRSKFLMGIITMSDIIKHLFDQKSISTFQSEGMMLQQDTLAILEHPVKDYMITKVLSVSPDCLVSEACQLMVDNHIHRILVTEEEQVVGIFTSFDASKVLAEMTHL